MNELQTPGKSTSKGPLISALITNALIIATVAIGYFCADQLKSNWAGQLDGLSKASDSLNGMKNAAIAHEGAETNTLSALEWFGEKGLKVQKYQILMGESQIGFVTIIFRLVAFLSTMGFLLPLAFLVKERRLKSQR